MIYLLDVNALLALGYSHHTFHFRVASWIQAENFPTLLTCSITELGFVRLLAQPPYALKLADALSLLLDMKQKSRNSFSFVADALDICSLPTWVRTSKQITDGHLLALAKAQGAAFATLDERIPGAYLIPHIT